MNTKHSEEIKILVNEINELKSLIQDFQLQKKNIQIVNNIDSNIQRDLLYYFFIIVGIVIAILVVYFTFSYFASLASQNFIFKGLSIVNSKMLGFISAANSINPVIESYIYTDPTTKYIVKLVVTSGEQGVFFKMSEDEPFVNLSTFLSAYYEKVHFENMTMDPNNLDYITASTQYMENIQFPGITG